MTGWIPRIAALLAVIVAVPSAGAAPQEGPGDKQEEAAPTPGDEMVTFDLREVEITTVIETLIYKRGLNIVASDAIEGKVTVKLTDVTWQEALAAILSTKGFGYRKEGKIILIDRLDALRQDQVGQVFSLLHLYAADVEELVRGMLSREGKLSVFRRGESTRGGSRTFVVHDSPEVIRKAQALLLQLDIPPEGVHLSLEGPDEAGKVSLSTKRAEVTDVLAIMAERLDLNLIVEGEVRGALTIDLADVSWEKVLELVLSTHGLGYVRDDGVIRVAPKEVLDKGLVTRLFQLQYLDANDVKAFVQDKLTKDGKVSVFNQAGRTTFSFGSEITEKRQAGEGAVLSRSKLLSVTDTPASLEVVKKLISELDREPEQIVIEVRIVEVILNDTEELGIDWNLEIGATGSSRPWTFPFNKYDEGGKFDPTPNRQGGTGGGGTGTTTQGTFPLGELFPAVETDAFTFGTLSASQLSATLRAMASRGDTNIVSNPRIQTLNNQEASILVGEKFPITLETIDPQTAVRTVTLDHFENIGIQLVVIPQIVGREGVNMIIHPAISELGSLIEDRFPVITTREADTQVLVRNNHTVVIGGLLQERTFHSVKKIPLLGDIPLLGYLFRFEKDEVRKVDLLIFVTPRIASGREPVLGGRESGRVSRKVYRILGPGDPRDGEEKEE